MTRPFYLIGHNTNSLAEVREAVANGLNAVELDIHRDEHGELYVSHDAVSALRRALPLAPAPALVPFLDELKAFADSPAGAALALVIFDCKIAEPALAARLLADVRAHLSEQGTTLHVLVSVPSLAAAAFFEPIRASLTEREGLMVDEEDDPRAVSEFFTRAGVERAAYGNGITSIAGFGLPKGHLTSCMERAVALRCLENLGFVYAWVLVDPELMRECLRIGVSGIMVEVSHARRLVEVLAEQPFASSLRRAARSDDPLALDESAVLVVETAEGAGAGTDANVTFSLELANGGSVSKSVAGALDGRFARATRTYVPLTGLAVNPDDVRSITVSHDGSGFGSPWELASVSLFGRSGSVRRASFDCLLTAGIEVTRSVEDALP